MFCFLGSRCNHAEKAATAADCLTKTILLISLERKQNYGRHIVNDFSLWMAISAYHLLQIFQNVFHPLETCTGYIIFVFDANVLLFATLLQNL